jgi:transcriptional regulator with XRE-family HTH domain
VFAEYFVWHSDNVRIPDMASAFGAILKEHRQAKGFSQEALAEKADIHPTHVSLIERCERNPSLNVAKSLASALGVSLASLIQEAEGLQANQRR